MTSDKHLGKLTRDGEEGEYDGGDAGTDHDTNEYCQQNRIRFPKRGTRVGGQDGTLFLPFVVTADRLDIGLGVLGEHRRIDLVGVGAAQENIRLPTSRYSRVGVNLVFGDVVIVFFFFAVIIIVIVIVVFHLLPNWLIECDIFDYRILCGDDDEWFLCRSSGRCGGRRSCCLQHFRNHGWL